VKFAPGILTGTSVRAIILMSLFEPETSNVRTEPPKGGFVFLAGPVSTVRWVFSAERTTAVFDVIHHDLKALPLDEELAQEQYLADEAAGA